jgi:anti-sigma factor ChrR (cupin superfamily)
MSRHELEELAALDAVGALDTETRRALAERLASATEEDRAAVSAIYEAATLLVTRLTPIAPPGHVKERLLAQVSAPAGMFSIRATERQWQATPFAGVELQPLHVDRAGNAAVILVRLARGAIYPAHHHSGAEECYVLSGDVSMHGQRLTTGDFHHASAGTDHGTLTSENGAELLLLVAASDYLPASRSSS